MNSFNARRYVLTETAISVAINIVVALVPASLSLGSGATAPVTGAQSLAFDSLPQLFMLGFMSALVPGMLTRRRLLKGRLGVSLGPGRTSVVRIVLTALLLASPPAAFGLIALGTLSPQLLDVGLTAGTTLLFKGAYGGLVAVVVTPAALLLLFGSR